MIDSATTNVFGHSLLTALVPIIMTELPGFLLLCVHISMEMAPYAILCRDVATFLLIIVLGRIPEPSQSR